jgi:hypothetical protein
LPRGRVTVPRLRRISTILGWRLRSEGAGGSPAGVGRRRLLPRWGGKGILGNDDDSGEGEEVRWGGRREASTRSERVAATHPHTPGGSKNSGPLGFPEPGGPSLPIPSVRWSGRASSGWFDWDGYVQAVPTVEIGLRICDCCNRVENNLRLLLIQEIFCHKNSVRFHRLLRFHKICYNPSGCSFTHAGMYFFLSFFTQQYIKCTNVFGTWRRRCLGMQTKQSRKSSYKEGTMQKMMVWLKPIKLLQAWSWCITYIYSWQSKVAVHLNTYKFVLRP